jgi:HTH-type transcriptional regulator / antitoxin HipB
LSHLKGAEYSLSVIDDKYALKDIYCNYVVQDINCILMDYPIQSPGQLSAHLRSLRKARGLNQVQLGAALGVGQARIARIERDPTAVSVEQFLGLLGALGVQMVLRSTGPRATDTPGVAQTKPVPAAPARPKTTGRSDEPW